ncbi:C5a anaphylatoxin chemotactic receptor 1-like [Acipenser ruthenus]|uniref:C5a anaphylatoxin chemotactic receptor 1-like n=1 Tax=Acipenser ruthenus TaxID=7906 RepID=UPI00145ABB43|nr:C5a anaphylatoxin chemotactic receptor 1-like [Acipenser ruthenus]
MGDFEEGWGYSYGDYNGSYPNNTDWDYKLVSGLGPLQYFIMVVYSLIFILGVPGNALVIWVTGFKMKRSVNTVWFLNLACADLLCCLSLPLMISWVAEDHHWSFGPLACKLIPGLILLNMFCSIFLLAVISADRCLLVAVPVWCQNRRRPAVAGWVCAAVWGLSLLATVPFFAHRKELTDDISLKILCNPDYSSLNEDIKAAELGITVYRFIVGFLVPFAAITGCHVFILSRVSGGQRASGRKSQKTRRVICAVVLTFFICWLPYNILGFIQALTPSDSPLVPHILTADLFCVCLAYLNSCLNPLLYVCVGQDFKDHVRKSLKSVLENVFAEDSPHSNSSIYSRSNTRSSISEKVQHSVI